MTSPASPCSWPRTSRPSSPAPPSTPTAAASPPAAGSGAPTGVGRTGHWLRRGDPGELSGFTLTCRSRAFVRLLPDRLGTTSAAQDLAGLEPGELAGELVEAHGAEVEGELVPGLEVEVGAVAALGVGPGVEPHPLADLVRDRLPRHPEVPVDLAAHEHLREHAPLDHERQRELGGPRLPGVEALVLGDRQLEVHADVDDDAHRAHGLGAQHAELVVGDVEVA